MLKRGMTLIELMVAMTLCAVMLLTMTVQFAVNLRIQTTINDDIAATQELEVAIYNMTQVLRSAMSSRVIGFSDPNYPDGSITATIQTATIVNGRYSASTTNVEYGLNKTNGNLYYIPDTGNPAPVPVVIAKNITRFVPSWDSANNNFNVNLTALKGNMAVSRTITIHSLPD